jgi:threonyl-tRNA synthetase
LAFLIERYNGAFPLWLSPTQVSLLPISDKHLGFAKKVKEQLQKTIPMLRVHIDERSESIGKKIRESMKEKTPYQAVVGDKEMEAGQVAVRGRNELDLGSISVEDFATRLKEEIDSKKI